MTTRDKITLIDLLGQTIALFEPRSYPAWWKSPRWRAVQSWREHFTVNGVLPLKPTGHSPAEARRVYRTHKKLAEDGLVVVVGRMIGLTPKGFDLALVSAGLPTVTGWSWITRRMVEAVSGGRDWINPHADGNIGGYVDLNTIAGNAKQLPDAEVGLLVRVGVGILHAQGIIRENHHPEHDICLYQLTTHQPGAILDTAPPAKWTPPTDYQRGHDRMTAALRSPELMNPVELYANYVSASCAMR
jgi:hypothetical protein